MNFNHHILMNVVMNPFTKLRKHHRNRKEHRKQTASSRALFAALKYNIGVAIGILQTHKYYIADEMSNANTEIICDMIHILAFGLRRQVVNLCLTIFKICDIPTLTQYMDNAEIEPYKLNSPYNIGWNIIYESEIIYPMYLLLDSVPIMVCGVSCGSDEQNYYHTFPVRGGIKLNIYHCKDDDNDWYKYNITTFSMLLDYGVDINAVNEYGNTILHTAASGNVGDMSQYNIIQLFINFGANPNIKNDKGETPLDLYKVHYDCNIGETYKEHIAKLLTPHVIFIKSVAKC